jgi:hypothetical protein
MILTRLNSLIRALRGLGISYDAIQAAMVEVVGVSRRADLTPDTLGIVEAHFGEWVDYLNDGDEPDLEKAWEAHLDYQTFLRGDWLHD